MTTATAQLFQQTQINKVQMSDRQTVERLLVNCHDLSLRNDILVSALKAMLITTDINTVKQLATDALMANRVGNTNPHELIGI